MPSRRGRGRPAHPDILTPAEWDVLEWVRHGLGRAEIARRRGTSVDAVKYHLANIADKLGVAGVANLRMWTGFRATSARRTRKEASTAVKDSLNLGSVGQVSLSVRDIGRAQRFYGEVLGLPHVFTFGDLAFYDCDGLRLYLHAKADDAWRPGSVLYFLVDDIGAATDELTRRGVSFSGAPHLIFTHDDSGVEEWMAFFDDGEGNTLALMSRVQPATAS